ncbi:MAG: hypothetical protein ABIR26_08000 [Ramlibacter sp.]
MTARTLATNNVLSRTHLLWIGLSLLVLGQLVAFWMLCSQQVRQAEIRVATLHAQRVDTGIHREPAVTAGVPHYVAYR